MRQGSFGADSVFVLGYASFSIIDSVLVSVLVWFVLRFVLEVPVRSEVPYRTVGA
jgi:hypothetical protein